MADRDTKVFEMVERELKKDPKVSGAVLQEKARPSLPTYVRHGARKELE